jgi:hypothetical protein
VLGGAALRSVGFQVGADAPLVALDVAAVGGARGADVLASPLVVQVGVAPTEAGHADLTL